MEIRQLTPEDVVMSRGDKMMVKEMCKVPREVDDIPKIRVRVINYLYKNHRELVEEAYRHILYEDGAGDIQYEEGVGDTDD